MIIHFNCNKSSMLDLVEPVFYWGKGDQGMYSSGLKETRVCVLVETRVCVLMG